MRSLAPDRVATDDGECRTEKLQQKAARGKAPLVIGHALHDAGDPQ